MNAFQFGQLVAEKMAEGPAPLAEAPMPTSVPHYQALADYTASAARKHDFSKAESGLNAQTKYLQSVLRGLDSKFYTHPVTRPAPLLPQAASSKSPPPRGTGMSQLKGR